jgi:hypothetical protein
LRQLEETTASGANARHDDTEDRLVSANLPEDTPVTEMNSLTRTAAYLIECGSTTTEADRDAHETRKKALIARFSKVMG